MFGVCFGGWGWGGCCLGFVLGGGGREDVVWSLFWGVVLGRGLFGVCFGGGGCFGFVVEGGGSWGRGYRE